MTNAAILLLRRFLHIIYKRGGRDQIVSRTNCRWITVHLASICFALFQALRLRIWKQNVTVFRITLYLQHYSYDCRFTACCAVLHPNNTAVVLQAGSGASGRGSAVASRSVLLLSVLLALVVSRSTSAHSLPGRKGNWSAAPPACRHCGLNIPRRHLRRLG